MLAGDHIYKMDYGAMLAYHVRAAHLTVACVEVPLADAGAFGVLSIDGNGRVVSFEEKPRRRSRSPASRNGPWRAWGSTCSTPLSCTNS